MSNWKIAFAVLACLHASQASFTCPDDSHDFYHADVSTGCQVYHRCQNYQMQTFTCPSGQAFNHQSSRCEDASTVNCYETMDHHSHHHHHKRAVEAHHTIDIQELKTKVVDVYYTMKPILREAIQAVAPTIYTKFEESYLPAIRERKEKLMPYWRKHVYPQVRKGFKYSLSLTGKIIEKLYQSYKLSSSTQITIVSISDLVEEISNDLQPYIRFGKYLSDKMNGGQSQQ